MPTPNFRSGWDFVPFTQSEFAEIAAYDEKEGRHWSSPAPACPTLEELCERLRGEVEGGAVAIETTPVAFSALVEVPVEVGEPTEVVEPVVTERAIVVVDGDSSVEVVPPSADAPPSM